MKKSRRFMLFALTFCCIQLKASEGIDLEQQRNKRNLAVFLDSEVKTSKVGMPLNIPTPFKSENMNCS